MASGARKFALQQLDRAAQDAVSLPAATVTGVATGGGTDGNALVTVSFRGASLALPHIASYTPAVGHRVALARCGGIWTVIGRLVGFPPTT